MNYSHTPWSNLFNLLPKWVERGILPPELDCDLYRLLHEDTRAWTDDEVTEHFLNHGIREGRLASAGAHRAGFLASLPDDIDVLEIGPFTKPALSGPRVRYFDVLDSEQLRSRATKVGYPVEGCPHIDYVSPQADMAIIPSEAFDVVFSSHCIEHQPDLVRHLQHVVRILKPGGRYYLISPDKRYCFDYFLEPSSTEKVIEAYESRRTVHTLLSVFEHFTLTTHTNTLEHWRGNHADPNISERANRAQAAAEVFQNSGGGYIDVHAWQFTPDSFREIIQQLGKLHLTSFRIERVYSTVWGQNEFNAVLTKPSEGT